MRRLWWGALRPLRFTQALVCRLRERVVLLPPLDSTILPTVQLASLIPPHAIPSKGGNVPMQVTTGTVIGVKIVCEGVALVEGSVVAVLSREPDEPFTLSPREEEELSAAMAEIYRGQFVTPDELLESLRPYG